MTMKAVRFTVPGAPPVVETVPIPTPGPGQVLVRIGGAGLCHSDLHVLDHGDTWRLRTKLFAQRPIPASPRN